MEEIALKTMFESMTEARTYGFDASADIFCNLLICLYTRRHRTLTT